MPTITLGAGAGTGASVSYDGDDTNGVITITTGTTPTAIAKLLTFEFDFPFEFAGVVQLTPANSEADEEYTCVYVSQNDSNKSKFTINTYSPGLPANARLQFYYSLVIGSKVTKFTMGEVDIQAGNDSGNGDLLLAQKTTLGQPGELQSLSFYAITAVGDLRLGVYSDNAGTPDALLAVCAPITPAVGWNTVNVVAPVALAAGTYWLAYCPSDNGLHFANNGAAIGNFAFFTFPYAALPATFDPTPTTGTDQWSFYGTLNLD